RRQLSFPQAPTGPIRGPTRIGPSLRKSGAASTPRSNRDEPGPQYHEPDPWHQRPESIGPLLQVTLARRSFLNVSRSHDREQGWPWPWRTDTGFPEADVRFGSEAEVFSASGMRPLHPWKRTSATATARSAWCHIRTPATQQTLAQRTAARVVAYREFTDRPAA